MKTKLPSAAEVKRRLGAMRKPWDWEKDKKRLLGPMEKPTDKTVKIVHEGRDVTGKAVYKNRLYHEAKEIREKLRDVLLTRTETMRPTEENIRKCQRSEGSPEAQRLAARYRECMLAQGAPKDERRSYSFRRWR